MWMCQFESIAEQDSSQIVLCSKSIKNIELGMSVRLSKMVSRGRLRLVMNPLIARSTEKKHNMYRIGRHEERRSLVKIFRMTLNTYKYPIIHSIMEAP